MSLRSIGGYGTNGLTLTLVSVIPGRGLSPASPESITLGWWLWIPGSPLRGAPE